MPAVDLFSNIDSRSLQQRQPNRLSSMASRQLAADGIRRNMTAAAAGQHQGPAAALATILAQWPAASSPMAENYTDKVADQSLATANEAATPSQQHTTRTASESELTPPENKECPHKQKKKTVGVAVKQVETATAAGSSGAAATVDTEPRLDVAGADSAANRTAFFVAPPATAPQAAAPQAAAAPVGNMAAYHQAFLNSFSLRTAAPDTYKQEFELLIRLKLMQRWFVSETYDQNRGTYQCIAFLAFGDSREEVERAWRNAAGKRRLGAVRRLQPVSAFPHNCSFGTAYLHAQQQCKQLVVETKKVFREIEVADGECRQCDVASNLIDKPHRWQSGDKDSLKQARQQALDALMYAVARCVLAHHPQLPQGLQLFSVQEELAVASHSTTSVVAHVDDVTAGFKQIGGGQV